MGRKYKCRICGEALDSSIAYKVVVNGKNFYCCSETEYEKAEAKRVKEAADKDHVYRLICDIVGRKEIINTILWKELKLWNLVADNETIAMYLEENKDYLTAMISRLEDIEFKRIRYLSAVLKNKLGDYKPKLKPIERPKIVESTSDFALFEQDIPKPKTTNECILEDVEDDLL